MVPSSSQEVAVPLPLLISLATTVTTIVVHGIALAAIVRFANIDSDARVSISGETLPS